MKTASTVCYVELLNMLQESIEVLLGSVMNFKSVLNIPLAVSIASRDNDLTSH